MFFHVLWYAPTVLPGYLLPSPGMYEEGGRTTQSMWHVFLCGCWLVLCHRAYFSSHPTNTHLVLFFPSIAVELFGEEKKNLGLAISFRNVCACVCDSVGIWLRNCLNIVQRSSRISILHCFHIVVVALLYFRAQWALAYDCCFCLSFNLYFGSMPCLPPKYICQIVSTLIKYHFFSPSSG